MLYDSILLIDDDEDDQEFFLMAIEAVSKSASVSVESSAEIAIRKLQSNELACDVIFLDLNMPVMNGKEFLIHLKKSEKLSQIPIIILSTSSDRETINETKALGAVDFITKPNSFNELKELLKTVLV